MNTTQPGVLDLIVRARFAALYLEADQHRLAAEARAARPRPERPARRPERAALRAIRSLGSRAIPAIVR